MKLHRRWAGRRAWRIRALLAALLALAAWPLRVWLGYWALALPLLALLYPSRRQEARALAEIDRSLGLAYRTALETPPSDPAYQRLRREAGEVEKRAALPRFPWLELALAAAVWLAAGLSPPPQLPAATERQAAEPPAQTAQRPEGQQAQGETGPTSSGQPGQLDGNQQEAKPNAGAEAEPAEANEGDQAGGEQTTSPDGAEGESAAGEKNDAGEAATPAGGEYDREQPARSGAGEPQPGGQEAGGKEVGGGQAQEKGEESGQTAAASGESGGVAGADNEEAAGGGNAGRPDGPTGNAAAPETMPLPPPQAPAELPSPWQGGAPPEDVQRAAERYIEDNPLPPGAAKALKRYFELGD